jgi:transcriptional regulator with XRE-family HTH domain
MSRTVSSPEIERFRRDYGSLREKYAHKEVAERAQISPANLSSYVSGRKNPGKDFLTKFYSAFEQELSELTNKVTEPPVVFNRADDRDDHIQTLKENNKDLRTYLDAMMANNSMLTQNNNELVKIHAELFAMLKRSLTDKPE